MRTARPSVRLAARPGRHAVRRDLVEEWERLFGAVALSLGLLILLSDLPSLWLGPLFGALFVLAGSLGVFRVLPGRRSTAFASLVLGALLFAPLTGLGVVGLQAFDIVAGAGLGTFGILKIT